MKIVLDDGAFKPYKAHPEDAGFDIMAREGQIKREVKKMNEDYTKLKDFAQKRLDDSCKNSNDDDVRYWVGYIDGLNALHKKIDGGKNNA